MAWTAQHDRYPEQSTTGHTSHGRFVTAVIGAVIVVAGCSSGRTAVREAPKRPPARPVSTTSPPTTVPVHRDPAQWPFASNSPWNTPLGSAAQYEDLSGACSQSLTESSNTATINAGFWSIEVTQASDSDPLVTITRSGVPVAQVRIPADATPAQPPVDQGGDAVLLIIEPDHRHVDELWHARRTANGWESSAYAQNDLTGSGGGSGGVRAYGGTALGGLIRTSELQARKIPHALALALTRSQLKSGFVWPAISEDFTDGQTPYHGNVPIGSLVAIPPSINIDAMDLSPQGHAIAKALQEYGAYVTDASATDALSAEPSAEQFAAPARADMERIRAMMRCVTNNGPTMIGGGGTPLTEFAPPL
jgi:hypothetical protein